MWPLYEKDYFSLIACTSYLEVGPPWDFPHIHWHASWCFCGSELVQRANLLKYHEYIFPDIVIARRRKLLADFLVLCLLPSFYPPHHCVPWALVQGLCWSYINWNWTPWSVVLFILIRSGFLHLLQKPPRLHCMGRWYARFFRRKTSDITTLLWHLWTTTITIIVKCP